MSEEEKRAIEYWKEQLKDYKKEIKQRQNDEFKGYGTPEDITKLKYCTLHTILNLIEKQQAEIEHQIEKRNNQKEELAILNEKQKEFNNLTNTLKSYKGQFKRQQKELEKKDKIINKMAEQLTSPIHSKEWVIEYYTKEAEDKYNE